MISPIFRLACCLGHSVACRTKATPSGVISSQLMNFLRQVNTLGGPQTLYPYIFAVDI